MERLQVRVKPNAPRTEILSHDAESGLYTVAVKAPPVDGKANAELERFFTKRLARPARVVAGRAGRKKVIALDSV